MKNVRFLAQLNSMFETGQNKKTKQKTFRCLVIEEFAGNSAEINKYQSYISYCTPTFGTPISKRFLSYTF